MYDINDGSHLPQKMLPCSVVQKPELAQAAVLFKTLTLLVNILYTTICAVALTTVEIVGSCTALQHVQLTTQAPS